MKSSVSLLVLSALAFAQLSFADPSEESQIQACIQSVCGPASSNQGGHEGSLSSGIHANASIEKTWKADWEPLIKQVLEVEVAADTVAAQKLEELVNRNFKPTANSVLQPVIALMYFVDKMGPLVEKTVEYTSNGFDFNEAKLKKEIKDMPAAHQIALMATAKYIFKVAYDSEGLNLSEWLSQRHPKLSIRDAQITEAKRILKKYEQLAKQFPSVPFSIFISPTELEMIQIAGTGQELNEVQSEKFRELSNNIDIYYLPLTFEPFRKVLLNANIDPAALYSPAKMKLYIQERKATKSQANKIIPYCKMKVASSYLVQMTPEKVERIQKMISSVKDASKSVVAKLVSPQALPYVNERIDKMEFSLPQDAKFILNQFKRDLKSTAERNLQIKEVMLNRKDPEFENLLFSITVMTSISDLGDEEEDKPSSDIYELCEDLQSLKVSDHVMTSLGKISVSGYTVAFPQSGVSILAHEVGHVIAGTLMAEIEKKHSANFYSSRMCVKNRNPFESNPVQNMEDYYDGKWTEEDWADNFSTLVGKELKRTRSPWATNKIMACSLVHDFGDKYYDKELKAADGDTHSSGALRLLLMTLDQGQVTSQCKPLIKEPMRSCVNP